MKIIIENVRSFDGYHEIDMKDISLLVGENSSGKSTLMAVISIVSDKYRFPFNADFNAQPYEMGNFNTIVTSRKGRAGKPKSFKIGYSKFYDDARIVKVISEYIDSDGVPSLSSVDIEFNKAYFKIRSDGAVYTCSLKFSSGDEYEFTTPSTLFTSNTSLGGLNYLLFSLVARSGSKDSKSIIKRDINKLFKEIEDNFPGNLLGSVKDVISIAPIRTKPKRTYDEFKEDFKPEGDHIPFLLSKILSNRIESTFFTETLKDYGVESGLFDDIRVKRLGNSYAEPFQLLIKQGSKESNIADVGYGVSQALPIIVECIQAGENVRILLQQPEVHLHPRAQAALGTFILKIAEQKSQSYVIETHSDYLIDRIRAEVASDKFNNENISIIFMNKVSGVTQSSELSIDSEGNVLDAPVEYRAFFIEEQFRSLGL